MHCPKRVAFLLAIAIASGAVAPAHAVQFTYYSGTQLDVAAQGVGNHPDFGSESQSDTDSDVSLLPGIHSITASAEGMPTSGGHPVGSGTATADAVYGTARIDFSNYASAYSSAFSVDFTANGSATSIGKVVFSVDTTGYYSISGNFNFPSWFGDGSAGGALSLSTGFSLVETNAVYNSPFEQLVLLHASSVYQLDSSVEAAVSSSASGVASATSSVHGHIEFVNTPEPSSLCLMTLGTAVVFRLRRRGAMLRR